MYAMLASVRGVVDLSPRDALDQAETLLARLNYTIVTRTATTVTAQRLALGQASGRENTHNLTVAVAPEPNGGVRINVRGNDQVGVRQRQAEWLEWSESLPRKPGTYTRETEVQRTSQTTGIPTSPASSLQGFAATPPPSYQVPPPPRQGSTVWRGTKLAFGGCVVMPILLVIGIVS